MSLQCVLLLKRESLPARKMLTLTVPVMLITARTRGAGGIPGDNLTISYMVGRVNVRCLIFLMVSTKRL